LRNRSVGERVPSPGSRSRGVCSVAHPPQARRLRGFRPGGRLGLFATTFANAATPLESGAGFDVLAEAGVGLALRGPLYDRTVRLRLDLPVWVSEPGLAFRQPGGRATTLRFALATGDLW
jgi:hypothetical protein